MKIVLSREKPFARGGNRLCFVHPEDATKCIKVKRPDISLEEKRRKKGFPRNLKPLSSFDDNLEEQRVMSALSRRFGDAVFCNVSRCYGFVATDLGEGLVSELIRDGDGGISHSLKKYIWDEGYTPDCRKAVDRLSERWRTLGIPSRDLILHNLVVQRRADGGIERIVAIDGLGDQGMVPVSWQPAWMRRYKAGRKIENMHERIASLLVDRDKGVFPGTHGLLLHDGREAGTCSTGGDRP
ncbi:MAG: YrbL family protein [Thiohalobacteraceae bacterium]